MKRTLATSALAALLSVQSDAWQFGRGLRIKKRCPPAITPRYCDNAGNCDVVDPCSGKPYKTPPPRPAFDVVGTHGGPRDASVVDFSRRAPGLGVLEALDDDESARHLFMKRKDYGHKLRAYSSRYLNSAASSNNKRQLFVSHERAGSRRLKKARRRSSSLRMSSKKNLVMIGKVSPC